MSFKEILGHEAPIRLLRGQIARGRVAHAYLFAGSEGIGKAALAQAFARALLCGQPQGSDACGACEPCRKISEGACPDLLAVGSESESGQVKIDQVRALEGFMALTPYGGKWKIGILDGADQLTEQATHACLKILEEPPDRSLFILLAAVPSRLAATVISRCHRVRCSPQGVERVAAWLRGKERMEPAAARMLAIASGGRIGLALQLSQGGRLARKNALLDQLLAASRKGELEISLARMTRQEMAEGLEWYAGWWRDLLVLSVGGEKDWLIHQDCFPELQRELQRGPGPLGSDQLLDRIDHVFEVRDAVQRNANLRTALAALLSR